MGWKIRASDQRKNRLQPTRLSPLTRRIVPTIIGSNYQEQLFRKTNFNLFAAIPLFPGSAIPRGSSNFFFKYIDLKPTQKPQTEIPQPGGSAEPPTLKAEAPTPPRAVEQTDAPGWRGRCEAVASPGMVGKADVSCHQCHVCVVTDDFFFLNVLCYSICLSELSVL